MTKNRVIGSGEGMPWSVPEEYQQFLNCIDGQTVIMGRRSFEIFGPDLTSTHNIVISRSAIDLPGVIACTSIEAALIKAKELGKTIFSAGGASIYTQTLPLASDMYLSFIRSEFSGDAYFPEFDENQWRVIERRQPLEFEFVHYRRK
ncbi:MAG: dihydrofolate reductase [Lentisphaeria bacterium]|jgi:dihydrofolate reductase